MWIPSFRTVCFNQAEHFSKMTLSCQFFLLISIIINSSFPFLYVDSDVLTYFDALTFINYLNNIASGIILIVFDIITFRYYGKIKGFVIIIFFPY